MTTMAQLESDTPVPEQTDAPAAMAGDDLRRDVGQLRTDSDRLNLGTRIMLVIGAVLLPTGVIIIVLGWWGASRTSNTFEQIPYLISGGLLGLALVFIGGFCYFTHWLTELVREARQQHGELLASLALLHGPGSGADTNGTDRRPGAQPQIGTGPMSRLPGPTRDGVDHDVLYATEHGSMAHRAHCAVLLEKPGIRVVDDDEVLTACRLCEPFADRSGHIDRGTR